MPMVNPGLPKLYTHFDRALYLYAALFVQKAFLLGLFSGELIFGGAYYRRVYYRREFKMGWA